jgi:hypothetical protein
LNFGEALGAMVGLVDFAEIECAVGMPARIFRSVTI